MAIKYLEDAQLKDKKVIARFDFNVPLKDGVISDTTRIDRALESIQYILNQGASRLVLMSHLGRPKGERVPELSLEPIATYLAEKLGEEVVLTESCTDSGIQTLLNLSKTKIVLLENLRFHKEETKNDSEFAKTLSEYADIYINDAFGTAHREHASTHKIVAYFKNNTFGGFLLKREVEALSKIVDAPKKPFVAIMGGAKVSDKIKTINALLPKVDELLIGGAMAYPLLKAKGFEIGKSLCSEEDVTLSKSLLSSDKNNKIKLPVDHLVTTEFDSDDATITNDENIDAEKLALDIGPKTLAHYGASLSKAKTVFWNGPMGLFERETYNKGTFNIAEKLATLDAYTVIGGGDSVSAVNKSGKAESMDHVSTGGGASLEFIEKGDLPGIRALKFGVNL